MSGVSLAGRGLPAEEGGAELHGGLRRSATEIWGWYISEVSLMAAEEEDEVAVSTSMLDPWLTWKMKHRKTKEWQTYKKDRASNLKQVAHRH